MEQIEEPDDNEEIEVENKCDKDFNVQEKRRNTAKVKKIDIMGPTTITADRLDLSFPQRTMFAASVVIALVLEIDKTNISRTSAWEMSQN